MYVIIHIHMYMYQICILVLFINLNYYCQKSQHRYVHNWQLILNGSRSFFVKINWLSRKGKYCEAKFPDNERHDVSLCRPKSLFTFSIQVYLYVPKYVCCMYIGRYLGFISCRHFCIGTHWWGRNNDNTCHDGTNCW